jgi:tripartite-type tricarboxylate transporter receptor subunit TctC
MSKEKRHFLIGFLLILSLLLVAFVAQSEAQEKYPNRAISVIVPFSPGGSTDTSARAMADFLSKKWNVPVNVVNKPGGNTIPGTLEVYSAAPDGYTMLADGQPMSTLLDVVIKDLPFKVLDRTFVAMTVMNPIITITPASSPYKTFQDLVNDAKSDPENFTWDSLGGVSGDDFAGRMIFNAIGVDVAKTKPVMAKGGADAALLAAGGHIKMADPAIISAWPHIQAGTVRVLAIALKERDPILKDVPTHAELGYPSVFCPFWLGVSGPPKLPPEISEIWSQAVKEMMSDEEYLSKVKKMFFRPFYHTPKEMVNYIMEEKKRAREVYKIEAK